MIFQMRELVTKGIKNPLVLLFVLLLLVEGGYKILYGTGYSEMRISSWFKLALQGFLIFKIIGSNYKKLIPVVLLCVIFFIGQFWAMPKEQLLKNILFLDKYLFTLLVLIYVGTIKGIEKYYPMLIRAFEVFIIINSILVLLGFVFEIPFFRTYKEERFGYDALILRSSAASYIYWIALFYFVHQITVLKKKKHASFILVLIASFLIGTKSIFIGYFFIGLYFYLREKWFKKTWLSILLSLLLILSLYFFEPLVVYVSSFSESFACVYEDHGIWSVVFSMRDIHLTNELIPLIESHWEWYNYLFGGGFDMHRRSQFGLFDLFYFFGIIGSIIYLRVFWKLFVTFKLDLYAKVFLLGTFVMMAFAANFFYETIMAMHLVFMQGYLRKQV